LDHILVSSASQNYELQPKKVPQVAKVPGISKSNSDATQATTIYLSDSSSPPKIWQLMSSSGKSPPSKSNQGGSNFDIHQVQPPIVNRPKSQMVKSSGQGMGRSATFQYPYLQLHSHIRRSRSTSPPAQRPAGADQQRRSLSPPAYGQATSQRATSSRPTKLVITTTATRRVTAVATEGRLPESFYSRLSIYNFGLILLGRRNFFGNSAASSKEQTCRFI
jgi:hypothetical protein